MAPDEARVRHAGHADAAAVTACTRTAYAKYVVRLGRQLEPMTMDYRQAIAEHQVWIMEARSGCVGVLVLMPQSDHMLIYSVVVDPAHQGRGYGRQLMALAERETRRHGLSELRLYTNALMGENIRFYKRIGYSETARHPHPKHPDSLLVFMSKDLGAPEPTH